MFTFKQFYWKSFHGGARKGGGQRDPRKYLYKDSGQSFKIMVLILGGSSVHDAQMRSETDNSICLRHLFLSTSDVTLFSSIRTAFFTRAPRFQSYHVLKVPRWKKCSKEMVPVLPFRPGSEFLLHRTRTTGRTTRTELQSQT